ncbi:MAG TPA: flagellar basal body rod protein FlgC [Phenylobacterium sp.]|jgi:flagellar basal-body rod protein FlgC
MGILDSLSISASALTAERTRMDVTAENLANAQTTRTAAGGAYRRKVVELAQDGGSAGFGAQLASAMGPAASRTDSGGGVKVTGIVNDATPLKTVYDPGHPDANAQGYVQMPNVEPVEEMVDLITESRSYEANVTAMQSAKTMFTRTLDLLR